MKSVWNAERLEFHALNKQEPICQFGGGKISSDTGGILLREVEQRTPILKRLRQCFIDHRNRELTYNMRRLEFLLRDQSVQGAG